MNITQLSKRTQWRTDADGIMRPVVTVAQYRVRRDREDVLVQIWRFHDEADGNAGEVFTFEYPMRDYWRALKNARMTP